MRVGHWLRVAAQASFLIAALTGARAEAQEPASFPWHIQILAVPSKTFSTQEFLRGDATGKDIALAGELRLPYAVLQGKVPAVVLVHGSGGIATNADVWARLLNEEGIAVFILDSFSARGIVSTVEDQSQLDSITMMFDAYRALDVLAAQPSIRPDRIAVMGFSKGAVASVFSASDRFASKYGGAHRFAAHVGMYTPCNTRFDGDTKVSRAPIRLFHGTSDDYVSVAPCRDFVAQLKAAGADVSLTEYADTWHAFDVPTYPPLFELKKAQSTRNCRVKEGPGGVLINAATGASFNAKSDPCVVMGAHIGFSATSAAAVHDAVSAFFKQTLLN